LNKINLFFPLFFVLNRKTKEKQKKTLMRKRPLDQKTSTELP